MKSRAMSGWQMVTADLALILFIITASAVESGDVLPSVEEEVTAEVQADRQPAIGNPVAIYRSQSDVALSEWLADQDIDPSQTITVWIEFAPDESALQLASAAAILEDIEAAGHEARILATPADTSDLSVVIAHDAPPRLGT